MKKKKKEKIYPIVVILLALLLYMGYLGASYWIPPNTETNIVGRYEFWVDTETCEVEVFDHITGETYYWSTSQVRSAIFSGEGIVVSGSEAGVRNCLGNDVWELIKPTTTTTIPPDGNGSGEIPVTALILLGVLGFIIIQGKKWLK